MEIACRKKTLVCLAADRKTMGGLLELIEDVGPYIAVLKTHVDLIEDWTQEGWVELCSIAKSADLLIFEDRKFADIGKISNKQMGGIYDVQSWADLVTAHLISGPDIVDGLCNAWKGVGNEGAVLLLAQMSSRGNLLLEDYTNSVVSLGNKHPGVVGFIGNGSNSKDLAVLREVVGGGKMIWTPGVNLAIGEGELGQRYGDPREAILAGSDCIIVGSGIHQSDSPVNSAMEYARVSWDALCERVS